MKTIALFITLALASAAQAATGMFGSYIQINTGTQVVYDMQTYGPVNPPDFNGKDFGSYITDFSVLSITNASGLTFKNGGGDVTGVELAYRVYKVGNTPGSFITRSLNFGANATSTDLGGNTFSGGGDQEWRGLTGGGSIDLLALATSGAGTYKVEVFEHAFTNQGDQYSNNGGSNFIATFTIPEPSRALLVMLGAALPLLRRRRA